MQIEAYQKHLDQLSAYHNLFLPKEELLWIESETEKTNHLLNITIDTLKNTNSQLEEGHQTRMSQEHSKGSYITYFAHNL